MTYKTFTIRVDTSLKDSFLKACNSMDSTAAREIRLFMRDYVKKNGQADLFDSEKAKRH